MTRTPKATTTTTTTTTTQAEPPMTDYLAGMLYMRRTAYRGTANDLARSMRSLARSLTQRAERLETALAEMGDGPAPSQTQETALRASVNSLGEVQGNGADIDRLCARLHAEMEQAAIYLGILQREQAAATARATREALAHPLAMPEA